MGESGFPVRHIALAVLGIALLAGGGYGTVVSTDSFNTCGSSTLVANDLPESPGEVVEFESLSSRQQELVRQSIERDPPAVTGDEWPWFESAVVVQYQGTSYELYTVTTECPFTPETMLLIAVLTMFLGLVAVAPISLRFIRSRRPE